MENVAKVARNVKNVGNVKNVAEWYPGRLPPTPVSLYNNCLKHLILYYAYFSFKLAHLQQKQAKTQHVSGSRPINTVFSALSGRPQGVGE